MKLLLINKNPVVSRMMMMSVPKAGFEIEECDDVYLLPSGSYDVVVIDDEMYDENFLKVIKQNLKYYQLGLVTNSKNINTSEFDFLLSKPFLPTDLIEILRKIKTDIESQKEKVPLFKEEEKEESSPFDMLVEESAPSLPPSPTQPQESIVQIEEEPEESPFVTENLEKSGVLDEGELSEVSKLLEEKEVSTFDEESSSSTPVVPEEPEQKEEKLKEPSLDEGLEQEVLPKRELKQVHTPTEALERVTQSVQNLSVVSLKELLDGMRLDITIKISFPDKKDV